MILSEVKHEKIFVHPLAFVFCLFTSLIPSTSLMEVKVYLPSTSFNPAPISLTFPPETTAKELAQELSKKFHVQGGGKEEEGSLVITPTSSTTGGVVEGRTCIKNFNLDVEVCHICTVKNITNKTLTKHSLTKKKKTI